MVNSKSSGIAGQYQKLKPITGKNIGKNHLKGGEGRKQYPAQGKKEQARALKNQLRIQNKD